jgi:ribonuclease P protein component
VEGQNRNTLPKKERLCGKTSISMLLAKGKHGNVSGMRYLCLKNTGNDTDRIMISVPKKLFKRAVKRNLLKRRIRESYRRQKHNLTVEGGLDVLFMYSTKEIMTYEQVYSAIGQIIDRINQSNNPKKDGTEAGQD